MFLIDSPISEENFNRIIDFMDLSPDQRVLDIGCGCGTLLKALADTYGICGVGIDKNERKLQVARERFNDSECVELIQANIADYIFDRKFDVVSCFGEWYGFPGLAYLSERVKPGGMILYGFNYWRKAPDDAYISNFGIVPDLVLFDEATSHLDSETESLVKNALNQLTKNRTSVVIAHRLSTLASCDRIIVIENGSAEEAGTHSELLQMKGTYYRLWRMQTENGVLKSDTIS